MSPREFEYDFNPYRSGLAGAGFEATNQPIIFSPPQPEIRLDSSYYGRLSQPTSWSWQNILGKTLDGVNSELGVLDRFSKPALEMFYNLGDKWSELKPLVNSDMDLIAKLPASKQPNTFGALTKWGSKFLNGTLGVLDAAEAYKQDVDLTGAAGRNFLDSAIKSVVQSGAASAGGLLVGAGLAASAPAWATLLLGAGGAYLAGKATGMAYDYASDLM